VPTCVRSEPKHLEMCFDVWREHLRLAKTRLWNVRTDFGVLSEEVQRVDASVALK
jgi:hypothetical protein